MRYAAFLRGINVGGHKPLKMADLRAAFEAMGFREVRTVQASGNVVFEAAHGEDEPDLAARIETQLGSMFGYRVGVIVRRHDALRRLVASAPFRTVSISPETRLYVTFLSQPAAEMTGSILERSRAGDSDNHSAGVTVVLATPGEVLSAITLTAGRGTPELMAFLERVLGSGITTRSWDTVIKVASG